MLVRFIGVSLIAVCAVFLYMLYERVHALPTAGAAELGLSFVVVLTGLPGALMLVAGDRLIAPPE